MKLYTPGPTMCPPEVLQALSKQMINHRGRRFAEILRSVTAKLQRACETDYDTVLFTSSGTGAMEAAIVNFLSPGDWVLAASVGYFGERFARIAERFGARTRRIEKPPGSALDPAELEERLAVSPFVKAVLVTHNETSTGVTNDLEGIARVARKHGALLIVDAISSLGSIPVRINAWGLDVVLSASQKGWGVPPGLGIMIVSPAAWETHRSASMPRHYFDLSSAKEALEKGATSWTPAVSLFFALDASLDLMLREGMENVYARHKRLAERLRGGLRKMQLELFADERHASNTVTAIRVPAGVDGRALIRMLEEEYGMEVAENYGELAGKVFRIGHMGFIDEAYIDEVLEALEAVLEKLRVP